MEKSPYVARELSRTAAADDGDAPRLGKLDIELTERCNNNCIHCCVNQAECDLAARQQELSAEQWLAILHEAAQLGCRTVRFSGGEPLLREDFEDLYLFATRQGIRIKIFTNGTRITSRMADLFARIPPLEKIEITVYGMRRESYEAVSRAPGSFDAAWRGIHLLLERRVPFMVKGVVLPPNRAEIDELDAWAAANLPWADHQPGHALYLDLRCRREAKANERIRKLRLEPEEGHAIRTRRAKDHLGEMRQFCSRGLCAPGDRLFTCGAGIMGGGIDAYGMFRPCMALRDPTTAYDLKEGSLATALAEFFPRVIGQQAMNPEYLARCARCFIKELCQQCPARSWTEHGTFDTPAEYYCRIAHAEARSLGLLAAGEKAWQVADGEKRLRRFTHGEVGNQGNVSTTAGTIGS